MSDQTCPCADFIFPQPIDNPPGLTSIAYRVGDYVAFREALLLAPTVATGLPAETSLSLWRPNATGDLALQMVEWWAYLADILTFYNERHANDSYLNTYEQAANLDLLIRVLGYRPRPGIGARATLAALVTGFSPITLPQGFQIQSKPGPGSQPQIFELDAATTLNPLASLALTAQAPTTAPLMAPTPQAASTTAGATTTPTAYTVLVAGVSTGVKVGDELLIVQSGAISADAYTLATVVASSQIKAPDGKPNTQLTLQGFSNANLPQNAVLTDGYQLLKSAQSAHVWQYPTGPAPTDQTAFPSGTTPVIQSTTVDLDSLARGIQVGDLIVFEIPAASGPASTPAPPTAQLATVTAYNERIYYANPGDAPHTTTPDPTVAPDPSSNIPAVPIPHTYLTFSPALDSSVITDTPAMRSSVIVRYGWKSAGEFIAVPATSVTASSGSLKPAANASAPTGQPVIIADSRGNGANAKADQTGAVQLTDTGVTLAPPLQALYNLLAVSRGKTVAGEVLGSGDATVAGQEFLVQQIPVTYLMAPPTASGLNYKSTLQVEVDTVFWTEVQSFYGQAPDARVFVTREDANHQTHVIFGDGVNGARLPTGTNNVVATYRTGSGQSAPPAGTLTTIVQPQPRLQAILNPIAAGGGSDPDPPGQIQRYAPQSVLTLGRAISADDYETIAAQAPGVARARSYWTWDPDEQRNLVKIYVGDDAGAVTSAQTALTNADDPNRPVKVALATAVPLVASFTVEIDSQYDPVAIRTAVTNALIDPDLGLLGANVVQIGQSLYVSQIYEACLAVQGTLALHNLAVAGYPGGTDYRFDPGEGGFFTLTAANLTVS
jgi:hypothetical protein